MVALSYIELTLSCMALTLSYSTSKLDFTFFYLDLRFSTCLFLFWVINLKWFISIDQKFCKIQSYKYVETLIGSPLIMEATLFGVSLS